MYFYCMILLLLFAFQTQALHVGQSPSGVESMRKSPAVPSQAIDQQNSIRNREKNGASAQTEQWYRTGETICCTGLSCVCSVCTAASVESVCGSSGLLQAIGIGGIVGGLVLSGLCVSHARNLVYDETYPTLYTLVRHRSGHEHTN